MPLLQLCEREIWGGHQTVSLGLTDRHCHTYVIGKTGAGKSTLLRNLLIQEIEANCGVGLIDPHGDLAQDVLEHIPPRRIDDCVLFDPTDTDHPCGVNVLRTGQPPDLVASSVVSAMKNIWRESWGPRMEYILYASVAALAECENVTLLGIPRLLTDDMYRSWVTRQVKDPVVRSFWSKEFSAYDKRFRNEAIAPVLNKVGQFLMSPRIRNILGQVRNRIDFRQILDRGGIFIANLAKAELGEEKTALLGSLLVSQFQMAATGRARMHPSDRRPWGLTIDEFHNFVSDSFSGVLSESRKYGLYLTLAHQFTEQLRPEIRHAVLGNAGALISFRIASADADILAKEIGEISPERLTLLERFEMVAKISVESYDQVLIAKSLPPLGARYRSGARIAARSRERFSRNRQDVEGKIEKWLAKRL